jgi:hypothetical protein
VTIHEVTFIREPAEPGASWPTIRLEIDGHDVAASAVGFEFGAYANTDGALPQATITLRLDRVELMTRADVEVDPNTAETLKVLGWTAPKVTK